MLCFCQIYINDKGKGVTEKRCLDDVIDSMYMTLSKLPEILKDRENLHAVIHEVGCKEVVMIEGLKNNNNKENTTSYLY